MLFWYEKRNKKLDLQSSFIKHVGEILAELCYADQDTDLLDTITVE